MLLQKPTCRRKQFSNSRNPFTKGSESRSGGPWGVNQSHQGVRTAQAIINFGADDGATSVDRGPAPIRSPGSATPWGRDYSATRQICWEGHDFANGDHRRKVANVLGIDETAIPTQNSWPLSSYFEGVLRGEIRGLWIVCTNPAHSWINQGQARDILKRLDFLVVQDMYHNTETAQLADLVLPAAAWGEKEGTFINSERRFGVVKPVSPAPGQALSDFRIFKLIAEYWGCGEIVSSVGIAAARVSIDQAIKCRPALRY